MERNEADVRNIRTYIDAWLSDLWKHGHPITNFASGEFATDEMINYTIDLKNRGEVARDEFIQQFTKNDSKLKYYDPIKRNQLKFFEKETKKKKHSIPEDEGQSFTEILATFHQKHLNLRKIMDYYVTSKPWSIVNEYEKSRGNNKSIFRNYLQSVSPAPKVQKPPDNISSLIVDAMTVVRLISIAGLKPRIFKSWADRIISYLSAILGKNLHIILDNYVYEYNVPTKQRNVSQMERCFNSLDQDLPPAKEWNEFLMNQKNKLQIVNLLVEYIKLGAVANKAVIVNQKSQ